MVQPFFSYPPSSPGRRSWLSQDSAYDALNAHGYSLTLCSREMVPSEDRGPHASHPPRWPRHPDPGNEVCI
jgi:hypothetical protein